MADGADGRCNFDVDAVAGLRASISGAVHLVNYYRECNSPRRIAWRRGTCGIPRLETSSVIFGDHRPGIDFTVCQRARTIQKFGLLLSDRHDHAGVHSVLVPPSCLHVFNIGKRWVEPDHVRIARKQKEALEKL